VPSAATFTITGICVSLEPFAIVTNAESVPRGWPAGRVTLSPSPRAPRPAGIVADATSVESHGASKAA